jgi:hypothetical protein
LHIYTVKEYAMKIRIALLAFVISLSLSGCIIPRGDGYRHDNDHHDNGCHDRGHDNDCHDRDHDGH